MTTTRNACLHCRLWRVACQHAPDIELEAPFSNGVRENRSRIVESSAAAPEPRCFVKMLWPFWMQVCPLDSRT